MNKIFIIPLLLLYSCNEKVTKTNNIESPEMEAIIQDDLPHMKNGNASAEFMNGDIVFIHSKSDLSSSISLATESDYTHCAIYWNMKGTGPGFFEASAEVENTLFDEFMQNREGNLLLVMRLKKRDELLDNLHQASLVNMMRKWLGKAYDGRFLWNDDELYCSELVYKLYEAAGIKLVELKKLGDFDLDSPIVQKELKKRYGNDIPLKEPVVAPVDLIYSKALDTIYYSK